MWVLKPNSGPPQEQQALLTIELSPPPLVLAINTVSFYRIWVFVMLRVEPKATGMLGKPSPTEV